MQLRCPENNCPIEVPEDLVGTRIRCPHCSAWLIVDARYRDPSSAQIQAAEPNMSLDALPTKAAPKESVNLADQIYDGLPPLSVMLALRRQQGTDFDADDFARRYPMTDDDWKALSAFESVLRSVVSLRTSLGLGAAALAVNLLILATIMSKDREQTGLDGIRFLTHLSSLFIVGGLIAFIYVGSEALRRIRLHSLATLLPWAACGIALVVVANAVTDFMAMAGGGTSEHEFAAVLGITINMVAAFDSSRSAWRVGRSLDEVSPPEISHRLTEALKYLE
jgi:hypothetical protein